jgi:hypothetical protein
MRLSRDSHVVGDIVFLDGLTGTGKTMLAPILSSYQRVEIGRLEHIYEYVCILDFLKKIERDAAEHLIRMYADLGLYNLMIARETNFRFGDLTGIFSNPGTISYIKRLLQSDGDPVLGRIEAQNPILNIIVHQALPAMRLAFDTFAERLKVVEMVRHPLHLIEHWYSYIEKYGTDRRDFTIWLECDGQTVPWFAVGWEEKFLASNPMDRVIFSLEWFTRQEEAIFGGLTEDERRRVLVVPFEPFVLEPWPFIERIGQLLGTSGSKATKRELKKQRCPRDMVAAGPAKAIYKRYGWKKPERGSNEEAELAGKREFAAREASEEGMKVLDNLCDKYVNRFGLWF